MPINQDPCVFWIAVQLQNSSSQKKGTRQGYPTFAYLFILVLEIGFQIIKTNQDVKSPNIFGHDFLSEADLGLLEHPRWSTLR